ncbi:RNA-directed DNA polymerase [bacterium]|nr:RNA-directed DNA polymerase [bacterium]
MSLASNKAYGYWLLKILFVAYYDARSGKRNTINQLNYEWLLERQILRLWWLILHRRYRLLPGIAFVVQEPKVREIFAATFRDRIVHHLVYNAIVDFWEARFIYDSYSCRIGKGTHFGVQRAAGFMRQASHNYTREAWVMKLDISGYFMNISRRLMWQIIRQKMLMSPQAHFSPWMRSLLYYLIPIIVFADPTIGVHKRGSQAKWNKLPRRKSLFYMPPGQGFPIGNLTSQLFSNIFLHELDSFVKHKLRIKYYGRYVDDFVLVDTSKQRLLAAHWEIERFLATRLHLTLHPHKVYIQPVTHGVTFVGAKITPHGISSAARARHNFRRFKRQTALRDQTQAWESSFASYYGHIDSCRRLRPHPTPMTFPKKPDFCQDLRLLVYGF